MEFPFADGVLEIGADMGRSIHAGRMWTICYRRYPAHVAFGGYKKSGVDRENQNDADSLSANKKCPGQLQYQSLGFFLYPDKKLWPSS
jgi:aldehyde dehydrogenase